MFPYSLPKPQPYQPTHVYQPPSVYRPPRSRAQLAILFIALTGVAAAFALVFRIQELDVFNRLMDGNVSLGDIKAAYDSDQRINNITLITSGLYILGAIPFLMWFGACYSNLLAFGAIGLRYGSSPRWASISFFIPILSLFRPYQNAKEILEYSQLRGDAASASTGWVVKWWWIGFIGMNITAFSFNQASIRLNSLFIDTLFNLNRAAIFYHSVMAIAAVMTINMILVLTRLQEQRYEELTGGSSSVISRA